MKIVQYGNKQDIKAQCKFCESIWSIKKNDMFSTVMGTQAGFRCEQCKTINLIEYPAESLPPFRTWLKRKAATYLYQLHLINDQQAFETAQNLFYYDEDSYREFINEYPKKADTITV